MIRATEFADAPSLPAIERSAGEAFRQLPHLSWIADDDVQSEARHMELIEAGASWVAVDPANQPIGFLSGEVLDEALHIWAMAVRHDHQSQGLGRQLIATAREWARSRNLRALTLTTFRGVRWNEPFYQSVGFRTLTENELSPRLKSILADEVRAGLPSELRCAMASMVSA